MCQEDTHERLVDASGAGYATLATNIPEFHKLNAMPIPFHPERLDEGCGILQTFKNNKATYHESCMLKFKSTKLERKRKSLCKTKDDDDAPSVKFTRSSHRSGEEDAEESKTEKEGICFICDKPALIKDLRLAMTLPLHEKLQQCATNLLDEKLLAKLSAGDIVSQDHMYHPSCLTGVYNRERAWLSSQKIGDDYVQYRQEACAHAFAELEMYIRDKQLTTDGCCYFTMVELYDLYKQRLEQLNVDASFVHRTRLKEQILARIPELEDFKKGREIWFAYKRKMGEAFATACDYNDALIVAKAAKILRKQMLEHEVEFDGTLTADIRRESVPPSLLEFVSVLQNGCDIKSQLKYGTSSTDLALAQLLYFNCRKNPASSTFIRHSKSREPPFPIYIGLLLFAKTRKRQLIDTLHKHGISITYDRVLELTKGLGEAVVTRAVEEEVVCPTTLRKGLFTTCAVDNLDHNPSATTAQSAFHGTGISLFQHPSIDEKGEDRNLIQIFQTGTK